MKLLWLSHFIPYPPRGGSRQRSFNLLRHISQKYQTHLFALNMQNEPPDRVAEWAGELRKFCAEVEIWEPPYPWRGARWWAQLALSPFYSEPYGCRALWSPTLNRRWREVLAQHPGALVHFDSIDLALYAPAARGFCGILNHHNCESAMAERRAFSEPNPVKKAYLWNQAAKLRRLEEGVCHQFDVNLTVSELDKQTLLKRNPHAHCHVVENGTNTEYFYPSEIPPEPNTIVFAGSLDWYPNIRGIQFFAGEIWPLLKRKCPGVRWFLAGRSPTEPVIRIATSDPDITLIPDPPDIRPWIWKAAVFVCPIIDGGGTRLKILDALAMGKAVVTTSIGIEGLSVGKSEHVLVADEPEDFAHEIVRVLGDQNLRKNLQHRGRALIENSYAWDVILRNVLGVYEALSRGGESPRETPLKG